LGWADYLPHDAQAIFFVQHQSVGVQPGHGLEKSQHLVFEHAEVGAVAFGFAFSVAAAFRQRLDNRSLKGVFIGNIHRCIRGNN